MPSVNYIHLRLATNSFSNINSHGGFTIGYVINDKNITYTFTRVNIADRYNKSIGRALVNSQLTGSVRCKTIGVAELLKIGYADRHFNPAVLSKLDVKDFNWDVINCAIRIAVEGEIGPNVHGVGLF